MSAEIKGSTHVGWDKYTKLSLDENDSACNGFRDSEQIKSCSACSCPLYELDASDAEIVGTGVGSDGGEPQFPTL